MTKQSQKKVFFLNLDLKQKMAGIELSALNRTKLFSSYLDIEPIFLTIGFNNVLFKDKEHVIASNRASKNLSIMSIYDYFLDTHNIKPEKSSDRNINHFRLLPVEEEPSDVRMYDTKGNLIGFCRRHKDDLSLSYINYFNKTGKIFRRETYDSRGFIIRTELIDSKSNDEDIMQDLYHRGNGSVGIIKSSSIKNNMASLHFIQLADKNNAFITHLENENDFVEYWLTDIIKNNPDAIFIVDRCNEFQNIIFNAKNKVKNQIKIFSVLHGVHTGGDVFGGPTNGWYKTTMENKDKLDGVVVLTENQKKDIEMRYGSGNYHVIPHSYDINLNSAPLSKREKNKIVYIARFSPEKKHEWAIEIFKKVIDKRPNTELHFYGFGNLEIENKVKDLINQFNLKEKCILHEFNQNVDAIYQNASLSILTSDTEGFCMGILESLSNGCPVISFNIKYGPAELIKDGVNGFLIPSFKLDEFSEKIIEILDNEALHASLISNAPKTVERFSHKNIANIWSSIL
jgi:glycosyltransferase involved in cell wall biosynthesis